MPIEKPRHTLDHPDYGLDCQAALEPFFQGLAFKAGEAGWDPTAVALALRDLALNAIKADDQTGRIQTPFEDPE